MTILSVKDLEKISKKFSRRLYLPEGVKINIGMASCGIAAGAKATLERALKEHPAGDSVEVRQTGCIGFCEEEPLVEILAGNKPRILYKRVTEDKFTDVLQDYLEEKFSKKLILGQMRDPRSILEEDRANPLEKVEPIKGIPFLDEVPFYAHQVKIALRNCGYIDPDSIEEYIGNVGPRPPGGGNRCPPASEASCFSPQRDPSGSTRWGEYPEGGRGAGRSVDGR